LGIFSFFVVSPPIFLVTLNFPPFPRSDCFFPCVGVPYVFFSVPKRPGKTSASPPSVRASTPALFPRTSLTRGVFHGGPLSLFLRPHLPPKIVLFLFFPSVFVSFSGGYSFFLKFVLSCRQSPLPCHDRPPFLFPFSSLP